MNLFDRGHKSFRVNILTVLMLIALTSGDRFVGSPNRSSQIPLSPIVEASTSKLCIEHGKPSADLSLQPNDGETKTQAEEAFKRLPLSFELNQGQFDRRAKFVARGPAFTLFLTSTEAVLSFTKKGHTSGSTDSQDASRSDVLRMQLIGSNRQSTLVGLEEQPWRTNYFSGRDAKDWHTQIVNYSKVRYRGIYPGIDLVYYGTRHEIEYDFLVIPGADYKRIKIGLTGAQKVRIDSTGNLLVSTRLGEYRQHKPLVYQDVNGTRQLIEAKFVLRGKRTAGFQVGKYDRSRPLVIDPVLSFSTFLGGSGLDQARAVAFDATGNVYVAGSTESANFPIVPGSFDTTYSQFSADAFVTKFNSNGTALSYSTYLGGGSNDFATAIVVDLSGNAYITGSTSSVGFPTTGGAYQTINRGAPDAFVTKLNNTGSSLVFSSFLGGGSEDQANAIALDSSGNVYVTGGTSSFTFPTTPGSFKTTFSGGSCCTLGDGFVTKFNPSGTGLLYSTFLGGSLADTSTAIAVDDSGRATVCGSTLSPNFPVTNGAYQTTYGGGGPLPSGSTGFGDAFVTRLDAAGATLIYSTFLGSTGDDGASGIGLDATGHAFVAGTSTSPSLPTTPGAIQVVGYGMVSSSDGGVSWRRPTLTVPSDFVNTIKIDPTNSQIAYAGTNTLGVYKTTDGGSNWFSVNNGLTSLQVHAASFIGSSKLFVGTQTGLFKTTDGGNSWVSGGLNSSVSAIAEDPNISTTLYALSSGFQKSTDGGETWTLVSPGPSTNTLVLDQKLSSFMYSSNLNEINRSTDGGITWQRLNFFGSVYSLATIGSTLYIVSDGVLKSTDFGQSFQPSDVGIVGKSSGTLAVDDGRLLYGGVDGAFGSSDGGSTWAARKGGLSNSVIAAIAFASSSNTAYAYVNGFGSGFLAKLMPDGSGVEFLSNLGGSFFPAALAIDSAGNAYIAGHTNSSLFSVTPSGFTPSVNTGSDGEGVVIKVNSSGTHIEYSTCLGGRGDERAYALAVDSAGSACVAGFTRSEDFPTTALAFQTHRGDSFNADAFVTKLQSTPSLTADLDLTISPTTTSLVAGSVATLDIALSNIGSEPAQAVTVSTFGDPAALFSYSLESSPIFTDPRSRNIVLAPGQTTKGKLFVSTSCRAADGEVLTFTIRVESLTPDSNSANNVASAQLTVVGGGPIPISPVTASFSSTGGTGTVNVTVPGTAGGPCDWVALSNSTWITITSNPLNFGNGVVTYSVSPNTSMSPRVGTMTIATQTFTVMQSASVGSSDTIGVYLPSTQTFYLRNSNSAGFADLTIQYGPPGATALVGDWNGDGIATIGVYDPSSQTFYLRNSNNAGFADLTIRYGPPGAVPLVGDWDGDGTDTIGVYDPPSQTFYLRNSNTAGFADFTIRYGPAGAVPIVGDWDGNGTTTIGVFDSANRTFYLRNSNTIGFADLTIQYGPPGATPVVGDWDGNGTVTIGVYDPTTQTFYLRNSNTVGFADLTIRYGPSGVMPLAGDWDGL